MTKATQEDINQISKLIAKNTLVVIRNQNLSIEVVEVSKRRVRRVVVILNEQITEEVNAK